MSHLFVEDSADFVTGYEPAFLETILKFIKIKGNIN